MIHLHPKPNNPSPNGRSSQRRSATERKSNMNWINHRKFVAVSLTAITVACLLPSAHAGPCVTVINTNLTFVVNTAAHPVPVTLQGASTVSGSVSITGTPTVNVATTTNTPVLVRDVDSQARQPFTTGVNIPLGVGIPGNTLVKVLTVPAGKRAVIETVTAEVLVGPGETPYASITAGDVNFSLALARQGFFDPQDLYIATFPIRLYSDTDVNVRFLRLPAGSPDAIAAFTIAGYFVNVP
jgi:hypothetical protein